MVARKSVRITTKGDGGPLQLLGIFIIGLTFTGKLWPFSYCMLRVACVTYIYARKEVSEQHYGLKKPVNFECLLTLFRLCPPHPCPHSTVGRINFNAAAASMGGTNQVELQ